METKDVHTEHCCVTHGCKYGNPDCSVTTGRKTQSYPCEDCRRSQSGKYFKLLQDLKGSDYYIYTACTGAGAGLQNIIWSEPGISKIFVGSVFPYNKHETDAFLGFTPDKYVSEETAIDMAMEAFIRAKTVAYKEGKWDQKCIGLGLTASVASEKAHRGDHRSFCCTISDNGIILSLVELYKGEGKTVRKQDGETVDQQALNELGYQIGPIKNLHNAFNWPERLAKCFWDRPVFTINRRLKESNSKIKFPGSFNPPHAGHFDMSARSSQFMSGGKVDYLINVDSPHKPNISIIECLCRVAMFRAAEEFSTSANAIYFTKGQPLFVDKVRTFPTCKFIVGADTLQRILDPKWGPSVSQVIDTIPHKSLITFSRRIDGKLLDTSSVCIGSFTPLADKVFPKILVDLGPSIPISSTQIREERKTTKISQPLDTITQ